MAHHSPDFQARDCSSEFLENVSRGKLSFPSESFFSYAKACLHVFNAITSKSSSTARCANRLHRLFMVLGNVYPCDFQGKLYPASRRLVNVFFKGFARCEIERSVALHNNGASDRKRQKLTDS